jgi:hypothetical protein
MALPATDTFTNGGSDVPLTTYSANWTYVNGTFTVPGVSDDCRSASGGVDCIARWNADTFAADHYSQAVLGIGGGAYLGVAVRCQSGAATAYFYDTNGSSGEIQRMNAGSVTQLATDSQTWAAGDVCRVEVTGTGATVTVTVKRAAAASPTSFSTVVSYGDISGSRITTAGYAGVYGFGNNVSTAGVDGWEGGDISGGSSSIKRLPAQMAGGFSDMTGGTA